MLPPCDYHRRPCEITAPVVLLVLAACGGSDTGENLDPGIAEMVDTLEAQGDCASLQMHFDRFDDAGTLDYIDSALESAGCYDD